MTGLNSSQSLNQTTETMMNNNNINNNQNNNIANNNIASTNKTSSDYDFEPFSVESYDQALFSPTMATKPFSSTNSPQALNSAEESFIFETSTGGHILVKYSQDYENLDFEMETNQISETYELPIEHKSKLLYSEPAVATDKSPFSNNVLIYDSMINGNNIVACNDDESCLEFTVPNFGDVMIKDDQLQYQQQQATHLTDNTNRATDCDGQNQFITNLLTPAPSPKTLDNQCLNINNDSSTNGRRCSQTKIEKLVIDDNRHLEHNYYNSNNNNNYKGNIANLQSCKRKLNMDDMEIPQSKKLKRRVPPLKIKIPPLIKEEIEEMKLNAVLDNVDELTISTPVLNEFLKGLNEVSTHIHIIVFYLTR